MRRAIGVIKRQVITDSQELATKLHRFIVTSCELQQSKNTIVTILQTVHLRKRADDVEESKSDKEVEEAIKGTTNSTAIA